MKCTTTLKYVALALLFAVTSCYDDDSVIVTPEAQNPTPDPDPVSLTDEVEVYDADKIHNNMTLAVNAGKTTAFLLSKTGQKVHDLHLTIL